jgi:electron transfer flavoprotein beta subunit
MTHIIVCVKVVMDPEIPISVFKVDPGTHKPIAPDGMPPVLSTFDESALEAALRIKADHDCKITVLSLGAEIPKALMQKIYAMGADNVIGIEDPQFEHLDPFSTARALAGAIEKVGDFDLVCMGRQSADWDSGLVWAGVAEALDLPSVTLARKATLGEGQVSVERCVSDGIELLVANMPTLLTFTGEVGEIRFCSLKDMMNAKKKKIVKWSAADIGFEKTDRLRLEALFEPELPAVDCRIIEGDTDAEKGRNLARLLAADGLV